MQIERQLEKLTIAHDLSSVKAWFKETITQEIPEGMPEGMDNIQKTRYISVECDDRPHADLANCFKKLRRHGLALLGLELKDEARTIKAWSVATIQIDGDMGLNQSRLKMKLGLKIDSTNKVSEIECPQVAMYPKDGEAGKYHDVEKMTPIVEDIVEEIWSYIFEGKFEAEVNPQLAIFPNHRKKKFELHNTH